MWKLVILLLGAIIIPSAVRGIRTKNTVWPLYNTFYPIKNNKIEFEVWAGHDAWIALYKEPYPAAPKYEILLGSYGDSLVQILRDRTNLLAKLKAQVLDYYDYRGFSINVENKTNGGLMLSVFRSGEARPFIWTIDRHQPIDVNYFALATTGPDNNGYWKVKGIDQASVIEVDTQYTKVTTNSTVGPPIYTTFYKMTDNVLRFYVKAPHWAWIRFTPKRASFPNYEICIGASFNKELVIYKTGTEVASYYKRAILNERNFIGFWIDITESKDYYGYKQMVICVGYENELTAFLRYIDTSPFGLAEYFSISTTSNTEGKLGLWKLVNMVSY